MLVGISKEIVPGERRVAITPANVPTLDASGVDVIVEMGVYATRVPINPFTEKVASPILDRTIWQ